MPQETKSNADLGHTELQGLAADSGDPVALRKAIELALDYRGDVTLTRASNGEHIECFIFDLRLGSADVDVRVIPKDQDARLAIPLADIASIRFTGRDTAAGRSFETWMKKYVQKKLAGETASIESERLE